MGIKRGRVAAALASAAVAVALGACSTGPTAQSGTSAGSVPGPTAAAASPVGSTAPPSVTAQASAATGPALQQLIDGARQEGQLSFTWGAGSMGGTEAINDLAAGFNRLYGLNVQVTYTPGPSMPSVEASIQQEYQANQTAMSDLYIGYATTMQPFVAAGVAQTVDWSSWAQNIQDPVLISGDGTAVEWESAVAGIAYNTQAITGDQVPTSMQDLLQPQYKGRIATTSYGAIFDYLAAPSLWGHDRLMDYVKQFSQQVSGLIRCDEMDRVTTGEFDLFGLTCSQSNAYQVSQKGAPVGFVVPTDAALSIPEYAAVPKNAAHPNAAKLWLNYLDSREAQDVLDQYDYADSLHVAGSKTAQELSDLQAMGVQLTNIDISFMRNLDPKQEDQNRRDIQATLAQSAPAT